MQFLATGGPAMRRTEIYCDRCGHICEADASILTPESGPLRRRRGAASIDLCVSCSAGLLAWLKPELPTLEPTHGPLRTVDPHLCEA